VQWNQTAQPYPRNQTIADLLTEKATQMDQAMALQFQDKTLTFAELNQQANH
jgi:non-ribosomal peptide synthetase component F